VVKCPACAAASSKRRSQSGEDGGAVDMRQS
jgi:hypothetical protein